MEGSIYVVTRDTGVGVGARVGAGSGTMSEWRVVLVPVRNDDNSKICHTGLGEIGWNLSWKCTGVWRQRLCIVNLSCGSHCCILPLSGRK